MTECSYQEKQQRCHEPAIFTIKATRAHSDWPLCERHTDPRFWPPDLHKLLPRAVIEAGSDDRAML
jgi:hypothetical protein